MRTTRGPISSYDKPDDAEDRVKARKPSPRPPRAVDPAQPLAGAARFKTTGGVRNLTLKLGLLAEDDPDDAARTMACVRALKTDRIKFRDYAYVTSAPEVIAWLRGRIYAGQLPAVEEDPAMLDVKCPREGCDYTVKNTKRGQRDLLAHINDAHREPA